MPPSYLIFLTLSHIFDECYFIDCYRYTFVEQLVLIIVFSKYLHTWRHASKTSLIFLHYTSR